MLLMGTGLFFFILFFDIILCLSVYSCSLMIRFCSLFFEIFVSTTSPILSNLNLDSICFLELKITGKYFFTLRITLKTEDISYRVYDTNYFYLKFWFFDGLNFSNHDIQIMTQDRNKNKMRVDLNNGYFFNIVFDKMGEVCETNISKKRGAKLNP